MKTVFPLIREKGYGCEVNSIFPKSGRSLAPSGNEREEKEKNIRSAIRPPHSKARYASRLGFARSLTVLKPICANPRFIGG